MICLVGSLGVVNKAEKVNDVLINIIGTSLLKSNVKYFNLHKTNDTYLLTERLICCTILIY
ncbi:hypothetical protein bsdtb5_41430 [Anaeromicropila herbilytica]|uniref:Uncharacterized protein n=1 Tax=Anaeromicropila herbilytica TaxID=2785025 RepID=A0A7R7EPX5_9FIRM|nr:hypothetical protein bsdtb5_41430 [Anaeromicropila herbilytica]